MTDGDRPGRATALLCVVAAVLLAGCAGSGAAVPRAPGNGQMNEAVTVVSQEAARTAPSTQRQVVRDARLRLDVPDEDRFSEIIDRAVAVAEAAEGYAAEIRSDGATLRIPDARLEAVMRQIAALGEVEDRSLHVTDVTARYTDLEIRIENARSLQARLRRLLERAEDVEDVLAVETELARVTVRLERLEGERRLLQDRVQLATLTLRLDEETRPGPLGYVFVGVYEAVKRLFVRD